MLAKYPNKRNVIEFVSLEAMVPEDHLLRKIDAAIDFDRIYDFVEDLYCEDNGRPSIDPVILFKIVLIQHIYGLPSLRRTLEEINMNMAYRWFLGLPINESIPHFSTVSHNFKHRFSQKTIEYVFRWILNTAAEEGYLDTEAVFVDGTHIKASANTKKKAKKMVPKQTKRYAKELLAEVNKDREEHGKKPFDDDDNEPPEEKEATISTTDPESGLFTKANTRNVLPMKPIPYVITITSSSMLSSQQEISTTALLSILCMTSYASITQTTKSSSQTVPTKPHGSAEGSLPVGEYYPPPIPDQKERKTVIHGMSMSMTAIMMTSSVPNTKPSIMPPPIVTATENTRAEDISVQTVRPENNAPAT